MYCGSALSVKLWPFGTDLYSKSLVDGDFGHSEVAWSISKPSVGICTASESHEWGHLALGLPSKVLVRLLFGTVDVS